MSESHTYGKVFEGFDEQKPPKEKPEDDAPKSDTEGGGTASRDDAFYDQLRHDIPSEHGQMGLDGEYHEYRED